MNALTQILFPDDSKHIAEVIKSPLDRGSRWEHEATKRGVSPEELLTDLSLVQPDNDAIAREVAQALLKP